MESIALAYENGRNDGLWAARGRTSYTDSAHEVAYAQGVAAGMKERDEILTAPPVVVAARQSPLLARIAAAR